MSDVANSFIPEFLSTSSVKIVNRHTEANPFTITLDRIFTNEEKQINVYNDIARTTISDVLIGYNGTIFTYGQSGSGKTHTMYGNDIWDDEIKGIIPRAM
jgi:DNA replication protein DnaC